MFCNVLDVELLGEIKAHADLELLGEIKARADVELLDEQRLMHASKRY